MIEQASLMQISPQKPETDLLYVVIETPKGCRNKYKHDEELGCFTLHKMLPLGSSFPYDFGFIPSTRGEDGDPLDVLVLMDEAAFPGCVVPIRLIGVLEATQTEKGESQSNDRLLAVLETPFNLPEITSLQELGENRLTEIEHFFISYNQFEGRDFRPTGRHGPSRAMKIVKEGMRRFQQTKEKKPL
jgi:inorganic pyrophosphatase